MTGQQITMHVFVEHDSDYLSVYIYKQETASINADYSSVVALPDMFARQTAINTITKAQ